MTSPIPARVRSLLAHGMRYVRDSIASTANGTWRYVPVLAVVAASLSITAYTFHTVHGWESDQVQQAFSEAAQDRVLVIQNEIELTLGVVQDVASFFEASPVVGRREFRKFVGPSLARHSYIKTLEWVPRVSGAERDLFVTQARRSFPPFKITERDNAGELRVAQNRVEHFPVLYVQPYQDNRERLGFDLASEPMELLTLAAARDSGAMHASPPIRFKPDDAGGWGFMVTMPVYERPQGAMGAEDPDPDDDLPRGELRGFALGVFRVAEIVETALGNLSPAGINIHVFADPSTGRRLYSHVTRLGEGGRASEPGAAAADSDLHLRLNHVLRVADEQWQIVSEAVPEYYQAARWSSVIVVVGGLAFTGLLAIYLLSLVNRSEKVRLLVEQRTAQLVDVVTELNKEIGERRHAEQQLQALNDTLELRVALRTGEAERRAGELEQFAYVTSHDLKAPWRAIGHLADWIEEDLEQVVDVSTREQLHLLRDRVGRMHGLIEGLLAYSRVGKTEGSISLVDSAELLAEIVDSLAPPGGFRVHVAPDMPTFRTDRLQLGQVFSNLISNSLKHHGGNSGNIWISVREAGDFFEFAVRDDGPGIAPEYHEKVFMMFQTLEPKDLATNTGIGLALVRKIIQERGGEIVLESTPGEGATFRFTWPREADIK